MKKFFDKALKLMNTQRHKLSKFFGADKTRPVPAGGVNYSLFTPDKPPRKQIWIGPGERGIMYYARKIALDARKPLRKLAGFSARTGRWGRSFCGFGAVGPKSRQVSRQNLIWMRSVFEAGQAKKPPVVVRRFGKGPRLRMYGVRRISAMRWQKAAA